MENTRRTSLEEWLRAQDVTLRRSTKQELNDYGEDFPNALLINGKLQDTTGMRINANMEKRIKQLLYNFTDGFLITWTDNQIKEYFKVG